MDKTDSADKDAGDFVTTSAIKVREARATLDKLTECAPVQHRYQPKATRVSWARRLLNWFMSRFAAV